MTSAPTTARSLGAALILAVALLPAIAGDAPSAKGTHTGGTHWSLQPLKSARELESLLPSEKNRRNLTRTGSNPINGFINLRLATNGLKLGPSAERPILLRRLTFDLTGLPPTPAEIDAFVADRSPRAWENVVERLLASPRYGERWARHWLDAARYTESQGFEYDKLRDNAWHYRDYVIRSFNEDKPYDQFMKEQIAGDVLGPVTTNGIIASSLLVCGPWDEAGNSQANATQKAITREEEMEDMLSVVGQTFLGLTINCARCHDHKFDPIPQQDYYRLKAVFEGVKHGERTMATPESVKARDAMSAGFKATITRAEETIARLEEEGWIRGNLADSQLEQWKAAQASLKSSRDSLRAIPALPVSYAGVRVQPEPTKFLRRGDVRNPEKVVAPAGLSAVGEIDADLGLEPDAPEAQRRLKFAQWLCDARNPLPARVMANRIWYLHFGQGLVATPNDFGASGAPPTHPELLDWLAAKFIESGWSMKSLHRLIILSSVYQQSSESRPHALERDADNLLLWRYPPRRLEAEAVRDAVLAVSGQLNLQMGGPSFRPFDVLKFPANAYQPVDKIGAEYNRRSIYRMNVNSGKEPLLDAFDCPDPAVKTPRRGVTTTPLQALALMNNSFVQRHAGHLAERAIKESQNDTDKAIQTAWRLALGRLPSREEAHRAQAAARERSLTNVCWALLNSTEFVYVR
jgi:hypothetical protein